MIFIFCFQRIKMLEKKDDVEPIRHFYTRKKRWCRTNKTCWSNFPPSTCIKYMNSIFLIISNLDNDLFKSCTSYTSCTIFEKNHFQLFVLKGQKGICGARKVFKHGSKKHESLEKEGGSVGDE